MATLGKWTGGVIAPLTPGTTYAAPNGMFPTEARNDSSAYTFTSSTSTLTLPSSGLADGYLMVAAVETEDASNGRYNPTGQFVQASGTGNFVTGETSGYSRDNSEDRAYVRVWAFVDNPSASSTYQFQWRRDSDSPGAADGIVRSEFVVIPFYYSNHGIYSSSTAALYGGTTPNQVTGFAAVDESDTAAIELSSNQFTVKGDNKKYFIIGSHFGDHGSSRTQRWGGLYTGSAMVRDAMSVAYMRNSSNEYGGGMFHTLVETSTTDVTYEMRKWRGDGVLDGEGGANSDGTTGTDHHYALVILELNDSAEGFHSIDATGGTEFATGGPIDVPIARTTDITFNDSASFTRSTDNAFNTEQDMDALFGGNISVASYIVGTGSRWTAYAEFTVNGTEQTDTFHGNYSRNNQGSQDTFGFSANPLSFLALTNGDDVGVSVTELTGTEGGGGAQRSPANWTGFWGLNLDTLEDAGGGGITGTSSTTVDDNTLSATGEADIDGTASITSADDTITTAGEVDITGTSATTDDDNTLSATGAVGNIITGTATITQDDNTLSAVGDVIIESISAITNDDDTLSSVGEVDITGTSTTTDDDNTLSSTGTVGDNITGTASITQDDNTLSGVGEVDITGTSAITNDSDSTATNGDVIVEGETPAGDTVYDFESSLTIDTGETSYFTRTANSAKNGSFGLLGRGSNSYREAVISGTDEALDGLHIGAWLRADDDGGHSFKAPGIIYCWTDASNHYVAGIDMRDPNIYIREPFSSFGSESSSLSNSSIVHDTWFWMEVTGNSTSSTATLYDDIGGTVIATVTRVDNTQTSGPIGVAVYSDGAFDDLTIISGGPAGIVGDDNTLSAAGTADENAVLNVTQDDNTLSSVGDVDVAGTSITTTDDNTLSSDVDVIVDGTSNNTDDDNTTSTDGDVIVDATASITQDDQTLSATGLVVAGLVGSAAITQDDNTLSSTGEVDVAGTSATTDDDNTTTTDGDVLISGTSSTTNDDNTTSTAGEIDIDGTSSTTNDDGNTSTDGDVLVSGISSTTKDNDTLSAAGVIGDINTGTLNTTQDDNTVISTGEVDITGTTGATQDGDTSTGDSDVIVDGTGAITAEGDSIATDGDVIVFGSLSATQDDDTLSATGGLTAEGTNTTTQDDQTLSATGTIVVDGTLNVTQDAQTLSATGSETGDGLDETQDDNTLTANGNVILIDFYRDPLRGVGCLNDTVNSRNNISTIIGKGSTQGITSKGNISTKSGVGSLKHKTGSGSIF